MFVVMSIQHFELEDSPDNLYRLPLPITIQTKMSGYLPVYETMDDARADFANSQIYEGRLVINKDK